MPVRVFIVDEKGNFRKTPTARFMRFWDGERREALPEYAGKSLRYAEVLVETVGRRPVRILRTLYMQMKVGPDGRPDPEDMEDLHRLSMESAEYPMREKEGVIPGGSFWAKKKLQDRYHWTPTAFEKRTLSRLVLGR